MRRGLLPGIAAISKQKNRRRTFFMKALRFIDNNLSVAEIAKPSEPNEALVRVLKSGICNTDLEIVRGYAGFQGTIGHEFVGVVEESKDSPELNGKRTVLGIINRDGCHAEFLTLPARNLLEVPANVSDEAAVFAEPLAAAYGITEQVDIFPETKVAVIGDGKLGTLCAMSLGLKSNNVRLIGKHPEKLAVAEKRNIEGILLDDAQKLKKHFDVVVESSGSESGFGLALNLIKPRGKLVLKSTFQGTPQWEAWRVVVEEITIVGSRCGRFAPALDLLKNKQIDVSDLITEEFHLRDGIKAIERAGEKGVMKVLLSMKS
jgi:threonine dehydrogenase-like Zn-dependent dehydrogenase